jgi:hypothetical protein
MAEFSTQRSDAARRRLKHVLEIQSTRACVEAADLDAKPSFIRAKDYAELVLLSVPRRQRPTSTKKVVQSDLGGADAIDGVVPAKGSSAG